MSELSGTAAVGIEAVEWLDGGAGNLTVRVTGRWRRRRPASGGPVTLVVEAEGRRHRFAAMPEPPSLGGAGPGMWQLSFSVPGWLAPALGGHTWLSLGTVTVPLPALGIGDPESLVPAPGPAERPPPGASADVPAAPGAPEGEAPEVGPPEVGAPEVGAGAPEVGAPELERRLADARAERDELAATLADARSERDELAATVAEGERTRRIAEQRAHAEQALRRDLARQLAEQERQAERAREAMGELAAAEERIRTLEHALGEARRRGDEAEQLAAATAARALAERSSPPVDATRHSELARVRFEERLRLRAHQAGTGARVPVEPALAPPPPVAEPAAAPPPVAEAPPAAPAPPAAGEPAPPAVADGSPGSLVQTLRRELDARAAAGAALRARTVTAESRLAARVLLDQRTTETLAALRAELGGLRAALHEERARRQTAERAASELGSERRGRVLAERRAARLASDLGGQRERSRDARDAIAELRGALERLQQPAPEPPPPSQEPPPATDRGSSGDPVQADRLTDALARLRGSVAAPEPAATASLALPGPGRRTLEAPFRRLVKADADAAGELLLDLLALQRAAYPHPIAYDLVLGPGRGCVRVTVGEGPPSVELTGAARTREEVDLRVIGPPARVARLLCAHGIWRRLRPRVARVRGRREGLAALQALLSLPLDLDGLTRTGARLRPRAVLALVAGMVAPAWTAGERFVVAHRDPEGQTVFLVARDGRSLQVLTAAPAGRIATTIAGSGQALVAALTGADAPDGEVTGDDGPLTSLRTWIAQAQSG